MRLRTSAFLEGGGDRHWEILTRSFGGKPGRVFEIVTVDADFIDGGSGGGAR